MEEVYCEQFKGKGMCLLPSEWNFVCTFFFMIVLRGGRAAHLTTTQDRQVVSLRTIRPNLLVQRVTAGLCSGVAVSLHGPCM